MSMTKKIRKTSRANFGSVRKLPSNRWQARYPDETGAPMNAPMTFETAADAHAHIATVRADRQRGLYHDPRKGERLLSDFAAEWLANGGSRGKLAPRTAELYSDLLTRHVNPTIGKIEIGKITPATVRNWYTALGKELAERAARPRKDTKNTAPRIATGQTRQGQAYRLLKGIMSTAQTDGLIGKNPCQITGAGKVPDSTRPLMRVQEFAQIVDALPEDLRPAVHAAFGAHLRLGEVVGLTRGQYNAKAGTLAVETQLVYLRGIGEVRTDPKTKRRHPVALPAATVAVMDEYLKTVHKAMPSEPLFVRADGRKLTRAQLQHAWDKARAETGLTQFHLHDLRGAGLTLSAQGGATVEELKDRAGHSTTAQVMRYQHAPEERGAIIADKMSAAIEAAPKKA